MRQLPLGVQLGVSLRFDTFVPGANAAVVEALRRLADGRLNAPVWVYGPPGSGRSHLLQAVCAEAGRAGRPAAYLPLAQLRTDGPQILDGFEQLALVALDDLDAVAGDAAFEAALFTLYNGLAEQQARLAIAAAGSPASTAVRLPDLASRLRACEVHRLEPLAESLQPDALRRRAERRGLELPDETLAFLTRRAPRDFATLCRMLDALDTESLAAQRRLTVPFVRDWLARGAA
ncbi:MAG TPA: DnaA regulatory inactivator Hda [Steroidobacteraceae bacterium]|nr:DnaA regulatory inactivator Hda [Steroidobacteraceae bacterium]